MVSQEVLRSKAVVRVRDFVCPGCVRGAEREVEGEDGSLEVDGADWQRLNSSVSWETCWTARLDWRGQ
jgi:hypothetical protein